MATGHAQLTGVSRNSWRWHLLMEERLFASRASARRATFVQRHAVLRHKDGREFTPLHFADQASTSMFLIRHAVMAYEYGYSIQAPRSFGFVGRRSLELRDWRSNAVIDGSISSAETKWGQRSSLVMLLPHGQEARGPDHSSARIERYLQLAAETTCGSFSPSPNHFHMLHSSLQSGLVSHSLLSPKQLLRLHAAHHVLRNSQQAPSLRVRRSRFSRGKQTMCRG